MTAKKKTSPGKPRASRPSSKSSPAEKPKKFKGRKHYPRICISCDKDMGISGPLPWGCKDHYLALVANGKGVQAVTCSAECRESIGITETDPIFSRDSMPVYQRNDEIARKVATEWFGGRSQ